MKATKLLLAGMIASSMSWSSAGYAQSLESAIAKALAEHPQSLAGQSRLQAEQKTISAARSAFLPSLDVVTGIGKQRKNQAAEGDERTNGITFTRKEASFSVRQNLFSGFNTMNSVAGAKESTQAEQWRLQETYEKLALEVVDAYLKVLERQDQLRLAKENLEDHNNIYAQIQKRAAQGIARNSDLIQIEGRRARANVNLISARNNLIDAESEYMSLTGHAPENLEQPGSYNLSLPESLELALKEARENHPGIQAADFDIQSSQSRYQALRSSHWPTLDFELDQNWKNNADGVLDSTREITAIVRVRYNVFRGGGDKARIEESAYKVEESRAQKDRTIRNAEERLRIAWAALELTGQQKEFLEIHEQSSRESVAAYQEQYNLGKRTLLDLLDSENELFQSSQSLTSAIYQEAFARYRVLSATGRLLEALNIRP